MDLRSSENSVDSRRVDQLVPFDNLLRNPSLNFMTNIEVPDKQCSNPSTNALNDYGYENNYKSEQFSPNDINKSPENLSMSNHVNNKSDKKLEVCNKSDSFMFENYSCSQKDSVAKFLELKPNLEEPYCGFGDIRKVVQGESTCELENRKTVQNNEVLFGLNLKNNLHKPYTSYLDQSKTNDVIFDNIKLLQNTKNSYGLNLNLKSDTINEPIFDADDRNLQQSLNPNRSTNLSESDLPRPNSVLQEPSYDFNLNRKPSSVLSEPKTDINICDQLNLTIEQQQELTSIKLQNIDSQQQSEEEDEENNLKEQDGNFAKQFNIFPAIFSRQLNFSQQQNNYNLNTSAAGIPTPPQSQHNLNFNLNQYSTNFNYHNMNNYYQEKMDELNTTRNLSLLGSMSGLLDEHLHTNFHGNLQNLHTNFHGNLQNLHSNLHHHHHHHHQTEMKFMPVLQDTR